MTKNVFVSIYYVANLYIFPQQKHPPYLLHRMFKTYVLTNNIKVNTLIFLSKGFMKLATINYGAGHLPPRRYIFSWPLLTRFFLLIPHCAFLWFQLISMIMEQDDIYKYYYTMYCNVKCATLADVVKHCVENHTNHVLRYRKLPLDGKSAMMKYQTRSYGIIPSILNRNSSVIVTVMIINSNIF